MKHAVLLTLIFFVKTISAQSEIKGVVKDAQTGEAIPYANVYFKNQPVGVTAFRDGSFVLRLDTVYRDSLIVSCIGYEPQAYFLPNLAKAKFVTVKLKPAQEQLAEVQVQPRKLKTVEIGLVKRRSRFSGATAKKTHARYIENAYRLNGFIKSVSVYVADEGIPTAPFRINILNVDDVSGAPSNPLIVKDFILQAEEGNEWVTIDISKELISFPPLGFFVTVQALPIDSNQLMAYQKALPDIKPSLVEWYAPTFGHHYEPYWEAAKYNWRYGWIKDGWEPLWRTYYEMGDTIKEFLGHTRAASIMIKAEISYYANQEKKVKDLNSKSQVKKVLDLPKKNELEYSQSSSRDLLQSIIKAVNSDELGYMCAYLLYFDNEEELRSTLDFVQIQKSNSDSPGFSPSQKAEITEVLRAIEGELEKLEPVPDERFLYHLNYAGNMYYFKNKDGIWKMSPKSTRMLRLTKD